MHLQRGDRHIGVAEVILTYILHGDFVILSEYAYTYGTHAGSKIIHFRIIHRPATLQ